MTEGVIPPPPIVLSNNGWTLLRTIDVPASDATYSDANWLQSQDVAAAKLAGVGVIQSSRGENGDIADLAVMLTVFGSDGQKLTGAELSASVVATIHVEEITTARFNEHTGQPRIVRLDQITDLATAGML
ncbi:MAG: hypothetical protein ACPGWS_09135, partial [Solirubrobacterales bacterium]